MRVYTFSVRLPVVKGLINGMLVTPPSSRTNNTNKLLLPPPSNSSGHIKSDI